MLRLLIAAAVAMAGFTVTAASTLAGPPSGSVPTDRVPEAASVSLDMAAIQASAQNTVRISARVCRGLHTTGSGFPISATQVVTNAHVVAGADAINVFTAGGRFVPATIVLIDPNRDIAILSVHGLGLTPLSIARTARGTQAVAIGYPHGGPQRTSVGVLQGSARVEFPDIYGRKMVRRDVWQIRVDLTHGNSGGPLVNADGGVIGVIFGSSTSDGGQAYAVTSDELNRDVLLAQGRSEAVPSGACLF